MPLVARLVELLKGAKVEPANVFVNLVEVERENWSFGEGKAQYA